MPPVSVSVDGHILPASAPHLSAWDRGFQLGDGVFETLRARAGRPVELEAHADRLRSSLELLEIASPHDIEARLASGIRDLLVTEQLDGPDGDAAVRITVSRGQAMSRGILPPTGLQPTVVIQAWAVEPPPAGYLADGLRLVVSSVRR